MSDNVEEFCTWIRRCLHRGGQDAASAARLLSGFAWDTDSNASYIYGEVRSDLDSLTVSRTQAAAPAITALATMVFALEDDEVELQRILDQFYRIFSVSEGTSKVIQRTPQALAVIQALTLLFPVLDIDTAVAFVEEYSEALGALIEQGSANETTLAAAELCTELIELLDNSGRDEAEIIR